MEKFIESLSQFLHLTGVFPVLFIAVWVTISYYLSRDSVWVKLKAKYADFTMPLTVGGKPLELHSGPGSLGSVRFEGVMLVAATAEGIIIKMRFPMNIGHPPLQIPWVQIIEFELTDSQQKQGGVMGMKLTGSASKKSYNDKYARFKMQELADQSLEIPWHVRMNNQIPAHLK